MAEECPKCGCPVPSIRLASHVRRCTALRSLPGRGTPAKPRRPVRFTTAELESQRVAEYYQQLWNKENEDLDDILREQSRKSKPRNASSCMSSAPAPANSGENQTRAKEIAAIKARIAELEAILHKRGET